jgi:endonuclease-3 related protein
VLTQNTNWLNVEKAIGNLKSADMLNAEALSQVDLTRLQDLIKPAGYYRQKSARLKRLASWVAERCDPSEAALASVNALPLERLKEDLLSLKGIGPETADSILLYALEKPVFVVDAYTVRIMARHSLIEWESSYEEVQTFFLDNLPVDIELFKDFHAQLVELGKRYCKRRDPRCAECPIRPVVGDPTRLYDGEQ